MLNFKPEDASFFEKMYKNQEDNLSSVYSRNIYELDIHKLAEINHPITGRIYDSMVNSIRKNGILEPITLWQEKVVDGRHRLKIAKKLKLFQIECRDWLGSEHELYEYLIAKERHRHSTRTQLAITAVFIHMRTSISAKDVVSSSGVSPSSFARAMFIVMNDKEITTSLRNGNQVLVMLDGKEFYTSALTQIEQYIKNKLEIASMTSEEIEDREYKETSEIAKEAKFIIDLINKSNDKSHIDRLKALIKDKIFTD